MKIYPVVGLIMLTGFLGAGVHAGDRATADEAKAMALTAAQYLRDAGPEAAFAAFTAKDSKWHDRDLYVFVTDQADKELANGGNPALVGKTMTTWKDADGKAILAEISAIKDAGWVEYKWQNPTSKAVEPKVTYIVRVGDYRVGVGAYK